MPETDAVQRLRNVAGNVLLAVLREKWKRQSSVTMKLAGTPVRFQGLGQPPLDWFGFEMYRGRLEKPVLECFAAAIRPGDTVLDIGAHIGVFALLGSARAGRSGRVFAFEPDPVAREHLARNAELNKAAIEIVPAAVSDSAGSVIIETGRLGSSQTRLAQAGIEVPTVTLDEFCEHHSIRPQVIKIDVEGAEERIVGRGAERTLREARTVIIEVHEGWGANSERIHRQFAEWGKSSVQLDERWAGQYNVAFTSG